MEGQLSMPFAEKIQKESLFVIRVIQFGNIRVFYGLNDIVFGIHAYVKKMEEIPDHELDRARHVLKLLIQGGLVK